MISFRESLLRGVDALAVSVQHAGQHFGFLSSNREAVIERDAGGFRFATLPDKSAEGWPPVELPLPPDARFRQAMGAVLTRTAMWSTAASSVTVVALMTAHFGSGSAALRQEGMVLSLTLPDQDTTIRVGPGNGRTLIAVRQRRRPAAIGDVLKAKAAGR